MKKSIAILCLIVVIIVGTGFSHDKTPEPLKTDTVAIKQVKTYDSYSIIAHGGGAIEGNKRTNSYEAWEYAYANGTRIIDADLRYTSDRVLVLQHDWKTGKKKHRIYRMNYETFCNTLKKDKYHSMSVSDMLDFMAEHPDLYVSCDLKEKKVQEFFEIVRIAREKNLSSVLKRIIIPVKSTKNYQKMHTIYPGVHWEYYVPNKKKLKWDRILNFCLTNDIPVVRVTKNVAKRDHAKIQKLLDHGIKVYVSVVNTEEEIQMLRNYGMTGFVSDVITENDVRKIPRS